MPRTKKQTTQELKADRLYKNLSSTLLQFIQGKSFKPMKLKDIFERLALPKQHQALCKNLLKHFVGDGTLVLEEGVYSLGRDAEALVTGIIRVHPRGFGFLQPEEHPLFSKEVFIPKHLTQHAVDGDRVEVLINLEVVSDKGPEGKVVCIITRGRTHVAGTVLYTLDNGKTYAYAPLLGLDHSVRIMPTDEIILAEGDRIIMKVIEWGVGDAETVCEFSHFIGHISDPSCDVEAAIEEHALRGSFPQAVLTEVKKFGTRVSQKDMTNRKDLRELVSVTIDPDTAKDFDDAISVHKDQKGQYHLGVHIADVAHYVQAGSAIDSEASSRCNSTYFPGTCLPMLPEELSTNLCSLKPNVNRLAISVLMLVDKEGVVLSHKIVRSVIRSQKRFTYRQAKLVLDGVKESKHAALLLLMQELGLLFKKQRYSRGGIEFTLPDLSLIVDDEGVVKGLDRVEYDITHQMIEEFMLKTNETIAKHLYDKGKTLAYRIHEEPSKDSVRDFIAVARSFGFSLPKEPTIEDLQNLFDQVGKGPHAQQLAISFIKSMRLAYYSPDNVGHYGLCLDHYCHFTSPIRRYVDLLVHRILFDEDDGADIQGISDQCSTQERLSARAETAVTLLKKLRYLEAEDKKTPGKRYEAAVMSVKPFGVQFEVTEVMVSGFLHVSQLDDDYYIYDEARQCLRGRRNGTRYGCGDVIYLNLVRIDLIKLESEWASASLSEASIKKNSKFKKKRRK